MTRKHWILTALVAFGFLAVAGAAGGALSSTWILTSTPGVLIFVGLMAIYSVLAAGTLSHLIERWER